MTSRTQVAAASAVAALLLLSACGSDPDASDAAPADEPGSAYPVTIENCGREVTFDEPPTSVLAMGGEAGSLLWAAGGIDAVTTYAVLEGEPLGDAGPELLDREQIQLPPTGEISKEAIIGAQPDLVVTFSLSQIPPEDLEDAGIKTLFVSGYCDGSHGVEADPDGTPIEMLLRDVADYGRVLGTDEAATAAVTDLEARITAVEERVAGTSDAAAAALFVSGPDQTLGAYGNESMVHEQLGILGLTNVFANAEERYFEPSVESFIGSEPEVVVGLYQAAAATPDDASVVDALAGDPRLAGVPAIEARAVLPLDYFYTGHGLLAIDGLERLADGLEDLDR